MSGRLISKAEGFDVAYKAFQDINFTAFDYATIKQSMIDYVKLYFPEAFNDFIESSEFIAHLELFAYLGELLMYRTDVAAHENFLPTAQRKQSILRLAKLISYKASRNLPARGLVKITSVNTTESVFDSRGTDLAGITIRWNDTANPFWKEQFLLVMNKVLKQPFGTVAPTERVQVQNVLFEQYEFNNTPLTTGVARYIAVSGGKSYAMELVPANLNENGPFEKRPENGASFALLYGSDGLGDGSNQTGFFMFTKQGTLTKRRTSFDGRTPNQLFDLDVININDTDLWINNIDPATEQILSDGSTDELRSGEWVPVDIENSENIIFNTSKNRNKYEIETLENDAVRIIFGDGEFSNIPSGTFDIWYRVSANEDFVIPQTAVSDVSTVFDYTDVQNKPQQFTVTFSLISTLQNAAASEDIEHIRRFAPGVYYSQDRMVNARDYNVFMLQDSSIIKLKSINRTFAGESKYINYSDPSGTYDNVKVFNTDLAVYYKTGTNAVQNVTEALTELSLLNNVLEPLLSNTLLYTYRAINEIPELSRVVFTNAERTALLFALGQANPAPQFPLYIYYNTTTLQYEATTSSAVNWIIKVTKPNSTVVWSVEYKTAFLVAESPTTKFWFTNNGQKVTVFDTLNDKDDIISILPANIKDTRDGVLSTNYDLIAIDNMLYDLGLPDAGLPNVNQVYCLSVDKNNDGLPDVVLFEELVDPAATLRWTGSQFRIDFGVAIQNVLVGGFPYTLTSPIKYVVGRDDVKTKLKTGVGSITVVEVGAGPLSNQANITACVTTATASFTVGTPGIVTTSPTHALSVGDPIQFQTSGTLPTGLSPATTYYVSSIVPPSSFQISATLGGPSLNFINVGVGAFGAHTVSANNGSSFDIRFVDHVYFSRNSISDPWVITTTNDTTKTNWDVDAAPGTNSGEMFKREVGRDSLNFVWLHKTSRYHLIDPAQTNIIDMFIITKPYYESVRKWLSDQLTVEPTAPTSLDLKIAYNQLLTNKMISDSVVLHTGKFKYLFGKHAAPELQATIKVIRSASSSLTDSQIKRDVVNTIRSFFDINKWEFGETFYFTELAAAIHKALVVDIDSVVLVPKFETNYFGDLYQVNAREDEIFLPSVDTSNIEIIDSLTRGNIKQIT